MAPNGLGDGRRECRGDHERRRRLVTIALKAVSKLPPAADSAATFVTRKIACVPRRLRVSLVTRVAARQGHASSALASLLNGSPHRSGTLVSCAFECVWCEMRVNLSRLPRSMADVLARYLQRHTAGHVPAHDVVSQVVEPQRPQAIKGVQPRVLSS